MRKTNTPAGKYVGREDGILNLLEPQMEVADENKGSLIIKNTRVVLI